jgi:hypothetical protein
MNFVDDRVELVDVHRHVALRFLVLDAHLGLETQPRKGSAQVVRDAGEHHRAVLLDLGELARHPVEAHVDLADLARHRRLVEARVVLALADPAGRDERSLSGRLIRPRDAGRAENGREQRDRDPERDRAGRHRPDPGRVDLQPERVARNREADPQARRSVHRAGDDRVGAELVAQLALDHALEAVDLERLPLVVRLARRQLHRLEGRDALDDRDPVDAVGAEQRGAGDVDEARDLLRAWIARGSNSSARKVWTQAKTPLASSSASRKKVRQKRLRGNFLASRGACAGLSRSESGVEEGRFAVRVATGRLLPYAAPSGTNT